MSEKPRIICDDEQLAPISGEPSYPVGLLFMQLETVPLAGPTMDTSRPDLSEE